MNWTVLPEEVTPGGAWRLYASASGVQRISNESHSHPTEDQAAVCRECDAYISARCGIESRFESISPQQFLASIRFRRKLRNALAANQAFLAGAPALNTQIQALANPAIAQIFTQLLAQIVKNTRQSSATIRNDLGGDLLDDSAQDT